jgi:4-hydroxythreonine-4-phosphate dehydrogenase
MTEKNQNQHPIIGITLGDINGIGPEVVMKALNDNRITKMFTPVIYGSGSIISYYRRLLNLENFNFNQSKDIEHIQYKKINVINAWPEKVEVTPGQPNPGGGLYAIKSLEAAVNDLQAEKIQGIVTAPLSKELVNENDFEFPGHTEYLEHKFGIKDDLMFMVSDDLRIGVVTGHIPLRQVSEQLTPEVLKSKLNLMIKSVHKDFGIKKPKIAILGLNPHAGENGLLGSEENEVLTPIIQEFKNDGHLIFGPFPADGFFGSTQFRNFDAILAMYHDQGLIPFKYIAGGEGVNFTAGLPVIRTSPAHGTGFNLAGKNVADESSMRKALFMAFDLAKHKMQN